MSTININKNECVHCGACTAVCDNNALQIKGNDWTLSYEKENCSGCQSCIAACPLRAITKAVF